MKPVKRTSEVAILLISLFINIIFTYFVGVVFKDTLIHKLKEGTYYQLVVFSSLLLPILINKVESFRYDYTFKKSLEQFKRNHTDIDTSKFSQDEIGMFDNIKNTDIHTIDAMKSLDAEIKRRKANS